MSKAGNMSGLTNSISAIKRVLVKAVRSVRLTRCERQPMEALETRTLLAAGTAADPLFDPSVVPFDASGAVLMDFATPSPLAGSVHATAYPISGSASVGDRVWRDLDGDGIQDAQEPGVDGVMVKLLTRAGVLDPGQNPSGYQIVDATLTSNGGYYRFENLPDGIYRLQFVAPQGLAFALPNRGGDTLDSDADVQTGLSHNIYLRSGQVDLSVDAGVRPGLTISGTQFYDQDRDNVRDEGEQGLADWIIRLHPLDYTSSTDPTARTDANGNYSFSGLIPGRYQVYVEYQSGWSAHGGYSKAVNLTGGQDATDVDFGAWPSMSLVPAGPMGAEFRVADGAEQHELTPSVALGRNSQKGVVTWCQIDGDNQVNIYARQCDTNGVLGTAFRVNTTLGRNPSAPVAAANDRGAFVIVWKSATSGGSGYELYGQRYDENGRLQGKEFRVNKNATNVTGEPAVAMDTSGSFVVAWENNGQIYARNFTQSGSAPAAEFPVNTTGTASRPDVVMDRGNGFVIAYQGIDADQGGIFYKRYRPDRSVSDSGQVNISHAGNQHDPSVAIAYDGMLIFAWASDAPDGSGTDIYYRRYDRDDRKTAGEFRVNTYTSGNQDHPEIACSYDGRDFLITWQSSSQDGSGEGIFGQRYSVVGLTIGSEFCVNATTEHNQSRPAAAMNYNGQTLVAWQSESKAGGPSDILAQWYQPIAHPSTLGGVVWNDLDADGIRDPNEPKLDGVKVTLYRGDSPIATTQTRNGGQYRFESLAPENLLYSLKFDTPAGFQLTQQDQGLNDTIDSDADPTTGRTVRFSLLGDRADLTWGAGFVPAGSIAGTIYNDLNGNGRADAGENGLADWVVYIDRNFNGQFDDGELSVKSDAAGAYRFEGLRPGVYRVAEIPQNNWRQTSPPGGAYAPLLVPGRAVQNADFGNVLEYGSAGGIVWNDANGDGIRTLEENGWANITVKLYTQAGDVVATTQTNGSGQYRFEGLPAGQPYCIEVERPTQKPVLFTLQNRGLNDALDSDIDESTGRTPVFTLALGQDFLTNDAGLINASQIAGKVYRDMTSNGRWDAADPLLEGYLVYIDANANGQLDAGERSATTNAKGEYLFDGLRPGTYRVSEVLSNGWEMLRPSDGFYAVTVESGRTYKGNDFALRVIDPMPPCIRVGSEIRVNTYTKDDQSYPDMAMDASGNFVIVWSSWNQENMEEEVYAQRFNASGSKLGGEFRVNTTKAGRQWQPAAAMDDSGDFVVTWLSENQDGAAIRAQRFDANGAPQGSELAVAAQGARQADVAIDADGDFAITWTSGKDILVQRYDSQGTPQGAATVIASSTSSTQGEPAIAMDDDGDFVVAWSRGDMWDIDVYARKFDNAGQALAGEFRVNTHISGRQNQPKVAMDADGDFVIAWSSLGQVEAMDVFAQRYDATGAAQGNEFRVNASVVADQSAADVAMDPDGNFVVAFQDSRQSGNSFDIYAQRFNRAGISQGAELLVNTRLPDTQSDPAVAIDPRGNVVVTWCSYNQDSTGTGIFAQRYQARAVSADIAEVTPDPRIGGVEEVVITFSEPVIGFGLADLTLTRNGGPNLLTADQTLASVNGKVWTVGNLASLTSIEGEYTFSLRAKGSNVTSVGGSAPLVGDAKDTFTVTGGTFQGTAGPDHFIVKRDGDELKIYVSSESSQATYSAPISTLGSLTLIGLGGNDTFTLDYSCGNISSSHGLLKINGSGQATDELDSDEIIIVRGSLGGSYMPSGNAPGSGTINIGGGLVLFSGAENLVVTGAASFTLVTPNPDDVLTVEQVQTQWQRITGTSGGVPMVPVSLPGQLPLTLNVGANDGEAGNDTVWIPAGLLSGTQLQVLGGTGDNSVLVEGGTVDFMPQMQIGDGPDSPEVVPFLGNFALTVKGDALATIYTGTGVTRLTLQDKARVNVRSDISRILRLRGLSLGEQTTLDLGGNTLVVENSLSPAPLLFQFRQPICLFF